MGFLFSKPAAPSPPELTKSQQAELDMKRARMDMRKAAKRVEKESENLKRNAVILGKAGKREPAIRMLKIRQLKQKRLKALWVQLDRLDRLVSSIETTRDAIRFTDSLRAGTAALKQLQEQMPIDRLEDLMAENDEALAYQDEVDDVLGRELAGTDMDEAEAELAAFMSPGPTAAATAVASADAASADTAPSEAADSEMQFPVAPTHVPMPEAPTSRVVASEAAPAAEAEATLA